MIKKAFKKLIKKLLIFYIRRLNPELLAYSFCVDELTDISILVERWWEDDAGQWWHSYGTKKELIVKERKTTNE